MVMLMYRNLSTDHRFIVSRYVLIELEYDKYHAGNKNRQFLPH